MLISCGKDKNCPQLIHEIKANINSGLIIGQLTSNVMESFVFFLPQVHSFNIKLLFYEMGNDIKHSEKKGL